MYDESCQLLTGLMMDYAMPLASERIWNAMASVGKADAHIEYFGIV